MLDSILLLALKTGWSHQEIKNLSVFEFNHYLSHLTKTKNG